MAFASASSSAQQSEINVTPLIDVLLVLLIIFMVIVPATPRAVQALVPQPPRQQAAEDFPRTIVVQVVANGGAPKYLINGQAFALSAIEPELTRIFATRAEKVMFVKGDKDLDFGTVAEVIGLGHQADVATIGVLTPAVEQGL
jgi:biopolymer transport protein ExbD/biopolymer transport protein TolR